MSTKTLKKIRDRLFQQHPFCKQCGIDLIHPETCYEITPNGKAQMIEPVPNNMATLEHKYSRFNYMRYERVKPGRRYCLLCAQCNNMNALNEHDMLPDELKLKLKEVQYLKDKIHRNMEIRRLIRAHRIGGEYYTGIVVLAPVGEEL